MAATVVSGSHPDAELLAACAALDELEQAYRDTGFNYECGSPEDLAAEAERERISQAQNPFVDCIVELRALTHEGQVTRARSLLFWSPDIMNESDYPIQRLTQAVLRDLIG